MADHGGLRHPQQPRLAARQLEGRLHGQNLIEFKSGLRILVEGNLFENNWVSAQAGSAILLKSVNQATTLDADRRRDLPPQRAAQHPHAVNIGTAQGTVLPSRRRASSSSTTVLQHRQLQRTTGGRMVAITGECSTSSSSTTPCSTLARVARPHGRHANGKGAQRFVFRNNIGTLGAYGWFASGGGQGTQALNFMFGDTWSASGNVTSARTARPTRAGNSRVASVDLVGSSARRPRTTRCSRAALPHGGGQRLHAAPLLDTLALMH
jgi:hypothetical protein